MGEETLLGSSLEFNLPELAVPLTAELIVVDVDKIPSYFKNFQQTREQLAFARNVELGQKVKAQVSDVYHSKAGPPEIVQFVDPKIPVVTSFKHLLDVLEFNLKRGEGGQVDLHLAQPDPEDLPYDFLQIPLEKEARVAAKQARQILFPQGRKKLQKVVRAVILDGSINQKAIENPTKDSERDKKVAFRKMLTWLQNLFPDSLFNMKIAGKFITQNTEGLLYKATNGLELKEAMDYLRGGRRNIIGNLGIDLYIGNPLNHEMLSDLATFITRSAQNPQIGEDMKRISTFFIGGLGGYGDYQPHAEMLDFFQTVWKFFPEMKIEVEHGRALVEKCGYALVPVDWDLERIATAFPDYKGKPEKLKIEEVDVSGKRTRMVHNVGYLNSERPEIKIRLI